MPLSPELRFLLRAVAAQCTDSPAPQLPGDVDACALPSLLKYHKLQLVLRAPLGLPPAQEREVSDLRKAAASHALRAVQELTVLTRLFQAAGIDMLVLKGAPLSVQLFGTPLGRYFGDTDLLVRPRDMARACRLLAASGYGVDDNLLEHHANAILMRARDRYFPIELHSQLAEYQALFDLKTDAAFAGSTMVTVGGQLVRTLNRDAAIAYAAYHGAGHHWSRLAWLLDIAAATRLPDVSWDHVAAVAAAAGAERHLNFALSLTQDLFGMKPAAVELPASSETWIARARALTLDIVAHPQSRDGLEPERTGQYVMRALAVNLSLQSRLPAKLAVLLSIARGVLHPSAADRAVVRLPRVLGFLYYAVRPFRVAAALLRGRPA